MFLYLATNNLMPGYCKIGISKDVDRRMQELYGNWVLTKKWEIDTAADVESIVKQCLSRLAVAGRELFNCPPAFVQELVENILTNQSDSLLNDILFNLPIKEIPRTSIDTTKMFMITNALNIGKLVRQKRRSVSLHQTDLATVSGTGARFISDLEKGKPTCEIEKALHVLRMLGIKIYLDTEGGAV